MTMGQRIAQQRKLLGLSQEGLGEKLGVSRQGVSKWEADGAVPEIDKLIALSRLFGVSIGWLLGVEDAPAAEPREDFSPRQLEVLEELLKKYQQPAKKPWLTPILVAVAAAAVLLWGVFTIQNHLQQQITTTNGRLDAISSQLNDMHGRISSMEALPSVEPGPTLLVEYAFNIEQTTDQPWAAITFQATPASWNKEDVAYLDIRSPDGNDSHTLCSWSGAFLTATRNMPLENGYTLCFTVEHPDGTQERQVLYDDQVQNLKSTLTIQAKGTLGRGIYKNGTLRLEELWVSVTAPVKGLEEKEIFWDHVDLVVMQDKTPEDAQEIARCHYLEEDEKSISYSMAMSRPAITFENLDLTTGDTLDLYIEAALTNGIHTRTYIGSVYIDKDGNLQ